MISPIGETGSQTRQRSDDVLDYIIKPAVEKYGFKAIRADQISEPGIITRQIIDRILNDDIVIADLSEYNPNVFYELAIRHAYRKPVIQLIQIGEKIPFDVAQNRTIFYDHHSMRSVEQAKNEISRQIDSINSGTADLDNPISYAKEISELRNSGSPEDERYSEILEILQEIQINIMQPQITKEQLLHKSEIEFLIGNFRSTLQEAFFRQSKLIDNLEKILDEDDKFNESTKNRINAATITANNVRNLLGILISDDQSDRLKRARSNLGQDQI